MKKLIYLLTNQGEKPTVLTILVIITLAFFTVFSWIIGPMIFRVGLIQLILIEMGIFGFYLIGVGFWRLIAFIRFSVKHKLENPKPQ